MLRPLSLTVSAGLCAVAWLSLPPRPAPAERAWSTQLHVHGPFSEGVGSIDSHSYEAADVGVDVIWWSDHDFRIASWRHVTTFGFDAWKAPLDRGESWSAWNETERSGLKELRMRSLRSMEGARASLDRREPASGAACLLLEGSDPGEELAEHVFVLRSDRALTQRPLAAEVELELAIEVLELGPDATGIVEVKLSEHPPRDGRRFKPHALRYVLTNARAEPWYEDETFCIPLAYELGGWGRFELPLTSDAARGFPGSPGADNSFQQVSFGIQSRRGGRAAVRFDDLHIRQRHTGAATFQRQAQLIEEVARLYPSTTQHQGVELSAMANHLNEYSLDTELLDFDGAVRSSGLVSGDPPTVAQEAFADYLVSTVVPAIQERGGLVSYNHMFGTRLPGEEPKATREAVLDELLRSRAAGADILEVGYRERGGHPLEDHLWVWDQLAQRGLHLIGVGVSDSHGSPVGRWRTGLNNFVSWIWSPTLAKADLLEGLRAGRVFFGDRVLFDGQLDLKTARGFRMGQVVLSDRDSAAVELVASGLEASAAVRVVVAGRPAATWSGGEAERTHALSLPADGDTSVRFEVRAEDGTAVVFSNPIWFVRSLPEGGLPAARGGVDLGGFRVTALSGLELSGAQVVREDGVRALRLSGRAENGTLRASTGDAAPRVRFEGLKGELAIEGSELRLTGISGDGALILY